MYKATTRKSKHDMKTDSDGKEIGKPIPSHDWYVCLHRNCA